ncbi:coiled-coil domain-containing protein [Mucilaginibacter arboris]|uniref:Adhesin domain-containing protein n=1 Tax=Mucilaginibacter arboris TaxID=2682090 RepID=A0A7K1SVQ9_9SPHI|nr:hypothetical protein [Mucilaginibacter arboris]MVN21318.1 hypothetical protein [Mucilaginibacter arboris]
MALKIYKTGFLALLFGMLSFSEGFAQQASPKKPETAEQQKDYQQKIKDLQQSMRDLQKQVLDLRQQHTKELLKQNAENLKELRFMRLDTITNFIRIDSLKNFSRALANNINGLTHIEILHNGFSFNDADGNKGKQPGNLIEKTKTFSKSYPVNKNDKLTIDNQYGKITVNTWNKNEFKVDVEIKVGTTDEAETQKLLDGINIVSAQDQAGVSFKTNIEKQDNKGTFSINRIVNNYRGNRTISVNYTVFMPVKNALDITNRFGAVVLPDLEGRVTIHNSYGKFTAKELSNTANNIRLQFIDADIEALNGGNLNFEYGNLKIGTASNMNAVMGFSPVNIERLKSSANIKVQYGSGLKINNLDKNLKNLDIDASFANVSLDLNGSENFLFDVTVKHTQFTYNDSRIKLLTQPDSGSDHKINFIKNYKGYVGKSGSDNKVTIKSNFQRVTFN